MFGSECHGRTGQTKHCLSSKIPLISLQIPQAGPHLVKNRDGGLGLGGLRKFGPFLGAGVDIGNPKIPEWKDP